MKNANMPGSGTLFELQKLIGPSACEDSTAIDCELANFWAGIPIIIVVLDHLGRIMYMNKCGLELFGHPAASLIGMDWFDLGADPAKRDQWRRLYTKAIQNHRLPRIPQEVWLLNSQGDTRLIRWRFYNKYQDQKELSHIFCTGEDITEKKQQELTLRKSVSNLQTIHALSRMEFRTEKELINYALEDAVKLTKSEIGYFEFITDNYIDLKSFSWSRSVSKSCGLACDRHYPLEEAGMWADSARLRKGVIHNSYKQIPDKKGYPEGHVEIVRHMSVPIFDNGQIIAICGVANKISDYTNQNMMDLQIFINEVWTIVQQRRNVEKIKHALMTAESADRAKNEFIAKMSHEIRTPMNGIIGMTELALTTRLTAMQRDYIENAKNSAYALLDIINDILDFSKIEAGKVNIQPVEFSLQNLVEKSIGILAVKCYEKKIELLYEIDPALPQTLIGDAGRIRQILINLLSNAIKFTEKGEILLTVKICDRPFDTPAGDGLPILFSVQDTGIGIAREKQEMIFESFTQIDSTTTRRHSGTGLGLTISKQLVRLMAGNIWVQSIPGQGSTFSFALPLQPSTPGRPHNAIPPIHLKKVLLVDDNRSNLRILNEMLSQWNVDADLCDNGPEALIKIQNSISQQQPYDGLIIDMQMPEMDGLSLVQKMKEDIPLWPRPIILMLSSTEAEQVMDKSRLVGIDLFLTKPVKMKDLGLALSCISKPMQPPPIKAAAEEAEASLWHKATFRILVAEDDEINLLIVSHIIKKHGFELVIAHDGSEAVEQFKNNKIDLIFMDIHMPLMDGFEATSAIRQLESGNKPTPIIALTADAMKGEREKCLAAGMDDYLAKPFKQQDIKDLLVRYAGQ